MTKEQLEEALKALTGERPGNSKGDVKNTSGPAAGPQTASTVPTNPNTSTGQGSGTDIDTTKVKGALDRFVDIVKEATNGIDVALKKLTGFGFSDAGNAAAGTASLKSIDDPSKTFNVAINTLAGQFGKLGKALQFTVGLIEDAGNRAYNASKLGGLGQGDSSALRAQAQAAGFKDDNALLEFLKNDQTRKSLAGSGVTSDEAIQKFNAFAEKLSKNPAIEKAIAENRIRREDLPGYAANIAGGKTDMLDTAAGREKLAQATSDYVLQLERATNAYGLNRDSVLKANQANNESAEEQLRQQYLGSDVQREQMRKNRALADGMGTSFQDAMSKIYAGQQLTAKDQAILQMGTGNRTGELQAAIRETKRTAGLDADDPVRKKAERDLEKQLANASRYQSSKEFAGIGLTTTDPAIAEAVRDLQLANQRKAAEAKASEGGKLTPMQAADAVRNQAALPQSGYRYDIEGLAGQKGGVTKNTGAEIASALAPVQDAYAKNTIALSQKIAEEIQALGANTKAINAFKETLTAPVGGPKNTVSGRVDANQETINKIKQLLGGGLVNEQDAEGKPTATPTGPTGDRSQTPVKTTPATPSSTTAPTGDRSQTPVRANRAHGTLGETGSPVEKTDVVAQLHAGERVLSADEVSKLANGVASSANLSATSLQKNNKIDGPAISTTATPTVGTTALPTVGTVKPVEAAFDNFDKVYNAVFKGTFDGVSQGMPRSSTTATQLTPAIDSKKETAANQFKNYPVKTGDTLTKISKDTGVSNEDIMKSNPAIKDRNKIYAGTNLEIPEVKVPAIPAPKVGVQIPDVKVPAIPAPTASEAAAELLRERRRGTPPTTTTVGVKLPAVEGLSTNKNPINKESTKQNTNQSTSIGSIFDLISSKISTVKSVIPSTATDKAISIIEKPLIDETSKVSTDGLNSKKLVDSISSTLTTVTGGGSVTRKEVQNEDAKAAEKQLAVLTSQYKSDRAAINDVIREKLGPEAKHIDVIRAMRDNPQAKALEDRLKVASESLNNRIGAGTSTQTSFESGITKSQLVVKEPPSLSISEGMKGYNSILGEATVDEGDEEPKAINLNDAEPGSKDLHDQLIQLNTTMRQLVEHSADSLDKADALRRTTSSLSGNRFA